jgi:hypothetical protein
VGSGADEGLVTNFARSLAGAGARSRAGATRFSLAAILGCLLALVFTAPAAAQVVSIGAVPVGLQAPVGAVGETEASTYSNPAGNPVLHSESTYAVYWDPTDHYHGDWQHVIDGYLANVGLASGELGTASGVLTQYTDKTNVPARYADNYHSAYTDTTAYPASGCVDPAPLQAADRIGTGKTTVCLTSTQIADQLESFVAAHGLPKGMGTVYYLLTPPAVTVCLDAGGASGHCSARSEVFETYDNSFCSYHADINPGGQPTGDGNTILYGVIPWVAGGFADPHLTFADQLPGFECQDGGFDPTSEPPGKHEKAHERSTSEEEAFAKMNKEEKEAVEEKEKYEGPHEQQPNQLSCPTSDGGCDTGLADPIITQIGLEQANIVTDPLLNGWQDAKKAENTDECRFDFAPAPNGSVAAEPGSHAGNLSNQALATGSYYINDVFNLAALRLPYPGVPCLSGASLVPQFTAPNHVNAGETVGFDGMESNISLDAAINFPGGGAPAATYATYTWNFGDGTTASGYAPGSPACESPWLTPCAASVFHAYTYGGTYPVSLTATDVGGHAASITELVEVNGPPAPSAAVPGAAAPGATGAGSGSGSGKGSGKGAGAQPGKPVATASVISHSLKTAVKKGVAVAYSVNEQVTGRFEVLISKSLAQKLKISGTPATGLPAGTPAELVIGKAILVTTKGGHSVEHVMLSKSASSRLRKAHKAQLMLRLIVRNAGSTPQSTTVISAATLVG